ncbi:LysR substrate-binding domain-containing protein, partial [Streptomyces sp. NPDC056948]|uniref:LysR substrate-binding domain-containing protein n=1 Tax=Streptomyces sp. NPDC056948 TaxID=3345975 RepID=UPI00362F2836
MELRWLESFVVVAEELHFARASDRLHLAPSALSAQIRALESHLGVRLVDRGRRTRPALTGAGRLFLEEARLTLAQAARAEAVGRRAGRGELGHAQIAYVASAAFSGVLTDVLTRCAAPGTELTVQVRELETPAQLEALACGDIDVGFLRFRPEYPPEVTATCLLTEQVVLALPAGAPLAAYDAVPAAQLRDECFVAPHFDEEYGCRDQILEVAEQGGFSPRCAPPVRDFVAALTMVGGGLAVALVPDSLRRVQIPGVAYRPLADVAPTPPGGGAKPKGGNTPAGRGVFPPRRVAAPPTAPARN